MSSIYHSLLITSSAKYQIQQQHKEMHMSTDNQSLNDNEESIERCPHDKSNFFSIISNNLIRDPNLSPHTVWLIIYLLSNTGNFRINTRQVVNFLKGKKGYGRDSVKSMFNEAIEAGYIKRVEYKKNNLNRIKYIVSEEPKFKKSLRHPENQEVEEFKESLQRTENQAAEISAPENTSHKEITSSTKYQVKSKEKKNIKKKKSYRENVELTEEEYEKLKEVYGNNTEQALDLLDNYKFTHGKKYANDYGVFKKDGWIHKKFFEDAKLKSGESNKDFAIKVAKKYQAQGVGAFNETIEFITGNYAKIIPYKENGFKEQVFSQLRKMNLSIE